MSTKLVVFIGLVAMVCADRWGGGNGHHGRHEPENFRDLIMIIQNNATLNAALITAVSGNSTLAALYLNTSSNGTNTINNYANLFGCYNLASTALANFFTQNINPAYSSRLATKISSDLNAISAFDTLLAGNQTVMNRLVGELLEHNYVSYVSGCVTSGSSSLSVSLSAVRQDGTAAFRELNEFYAEGARTQFLCKNRGRGGRD